MNKKDVYTIGISCIGSGVGQSVITSCRLSSLPLKTVGFGTNPFAFGAYECDAFDYTPTIYADDFVEKLIEKCIEHDVDLLIPGRDDEALIYAQNRTKFVEAGIKILVAGKEIIEICRDKEKMSHDLNPIVDVFVKCYERDQLTELLNDGRAEFPLIAKPRGGFASQGIEIILSEADFSRITDDHIIQELAIPLASDPNFSFYIKEIAKNNNPQVSEISIQIVLGVDGEIIGKMASFNKLNNGVPIEIVPYESDSLWEVVDQLIPIFRAKGLVGPLNIQGRLTQKGLKLFEMNPRFTGITGLRALMGFNEVEACIKSWLAIDSSPKLSINNNRFGIRQTTDKVISFARNDKAMDFATSVNSGRVLKPKRTVLITGASGYLGQMLVKKISNDQTFDVIVCGRDVHKLTRLYSNSGVTVQSNDDIFNSAISLGNIDLAIHLGFARPHQSNEEIAQSLEFTNRLFFKLASQQVSEIINISSQSVYGDLNVRFWNEDSSISPQGLYGQAKYASELMLQSVKSIHPHLNCTSLRLGTLAGGHDGLEPVDALSKLVLEALSKNEITLLNGELEFDRLDLRDAVDGIMKLVCHNSIMWNPTYNMGAEKSISLSEISGIIKDSVASLSNTELTVIDQKKEFSRKPKLNSELFKSHFQWTPESSMKSTVGTLVNYFSK